MSFGSSISEMGGHRHMSRRGNAYPLLSSYSPGTPMVFGFKVCLRSNLAMISLKRIEAFGDNSNY
jgi:hypothetical protein